MDGATSSASPDSKRVETGMLAIEETSQQGHQTRINGNIPEPSTAPPRHPKQPPDQLDPPRRQGRLKPRPKGVSRSEWTYQGEQPHQGQTGHVQAI